MVIEDNTLKKKCPQCIFLFHFLLLQLPLLLPPAPNPQPPGLLLLDSQWLLSFATSVDLFMGLSLSIKSIFAGKKS